MNFLNMPYSAFLTINADILGATDQRRDFWEDVANLRDEEGRMHYTGVLTLRRIAHERPSGRFP